MVDNYKHNPINNNLQIKVTKNKNNMIQYCILNNNVNSFL